MKRLLVILALVGGLKAEDKHHFSGMARIGSLAVAAQLEDFDPIHTPALQLKNLYRIRLTPDQAGLPTLNQTCTVTVEATTAGHYTLSFCGWFLDLTPADRLIFLSLQSQAGIFVTSNQFVTSDVVDGARELTFRQ